MELKMKGETSPRGKNADHIKNMERTRKQQLEVKLSILILDLVVKRLTLLSA